MTIQWTATFILLSTLLLGCGDNGRKQLTGVDRPVAVNESEKVISLKNISPVKTKVENILESREITKESQMDPSDKSLILLAHFNEESIYTGFIINAFNTNNPFRGEIITLKTEPTGQADQTEIQIINGRGEYIKTIHTHNGGPEISFVDHKITLHKENDCLIIEKTNAEYTGVVCKSQAQEKVEKTEVDEEVTEEKLEVKDEQQEEEQQEINR